MKSCVCFPFKLVVLILLFCLSVVAHSQSTKLVTEQAWQQIKSLGGIRSQAGMTNPSVFVFFDPNCPHCAKLWQTKIGVAEFNQIPAVWIPVTYLGDSALGKGAALLRDNSQQSLAQNFGQFSYETRQGAIAAVSPTDKEKNQLGQAKSVWLKLGGATPLIVFRDRAGQAQLFIGLPSDSKLTEISLHFTPSSLSTFPSK